MPCATVSDNYGPLGLREAFVCPWVCAEMYVSFYIVGLSGLASLKLRMACRPVCCKWMLRCTTVEYILSIAPSHLGCKDGKRIITDRGLIALSKLGKRS